LLNAKHGTKFVSFTLTPASRNRQTETTSNEIHETIKLWFFDLTPFSPYTVFVPGLGGECFCQWL